MPEISRFYGLIIYIFYDDHVPPHFHVKYAEYDAVMGIENLSLIKGNLPARALGLVTEWAALHQKELREDWERSLKQKPLKKIAPLP